MLSAEYLHLLVDEALSRAKAEMDIEMELEDGSSHEATIDVRHLEKILAKLLLDF